MRRKPGIKKIEKEFIENSASSRAEQNSSEEITITQNVHLKWPVSNLEKNPLMEEGSSLRRPINLPLKEFEWNTIETHTKKLGVGKSEWIRHAIYRLLIEEQTHYFTNVSENE